jgi:predicted transcriptional regulator
VDYEIGFAAVEKGEFAEHDEVREMIESRYPVQP